MAKRTPGLELVASIIPKSVHALGPEVEKKYRRFYVLWHWADIVGNAIAANVHPIGMEHGRLWLYTPSASWRNEIQMMQMEILQKVNRYAGEKLVSEMRFSGRREKVLVFDRTELPPPVHFGRELAKKNLPKEKIEDIRQECSSVEDDDLRMKLQELLLKQGKLNQWREEQGWHPCVDCGVLCPKDAKRCTVCSARHEEAVRERVYRILQELPWLRYGEIKAQVPECTSYMASSLRASMVQELARKVKLEDIRSLAAKRLVMLYHCLPPEQLTEDLIRRTLYKLRLDLVRPENFKPMKRYDYILRGKEKGREPHVPSSGK